MREGVPIASRLIGLGATCEDHDAPWNRLTDLAAATTTWTWKATTSVSVLHLKEREGAFEPGSDRKRSIQ